MIMKKQSQNNGGFYMCKNTVLIINFVKIDKICIIRWMNI